MAVGVEGGEGGEGGGGGGGVGEEGVGGADVVAVGAELPEAEEEGLLLDSLTLRHAIIKITQNIFDNALPSPEHHDVGLPLAPPRLVLPHPLQRRQHLLEPFPQRLVERLALDVLDEQVLRVLLDALLHLRLDRQDEVVLRQRCYYVEVVVLHQLRRTVLRRKELFGVEFLLYALACRLLRHWGL